MMENRDRRDIRDQANRPFQHGLNANNAFTERVSYFLIAESTQIVACIGLLNIGQYSGTTTTPLTDTIMVAMPQARGLRRK